MQLSAFDSSGLSPEMRKGYKCPCCSQRVKIYKRKLNVAQAHALILVYVWFKNNPEKEWCNVRQFDTTAFRGGDWAKLRYFGLISEKSNEDKTKRTSGLWKVTAKGGCFVRSEISVPEHLLIFNQTVYGFEGKEIFIRDALRNKFNYEELMNS